MEYRFRRRKVQFRFDPNQPRDDHGRWTTTGGGSGGSGDSVGDGSVLAATRQLGEYVPIPSKADLEAGFDPVPDTPEVESTFLMHMDENGNLTPQRQQVHDELIAEALTNPKTGEPYPTSTKPTALLMGGGAASGKSTAIKSGFVDAPPDAVTINPDEFKIALPEAKGPSADGKQGNGLADKYGDAWASITHEESSHLGKRLTAAALDRQTNILIDKTSSDGPKAVREIQRLQDAGYEVEVAYVTTEVDQAVANALSRQEKTGRKVPEPVLRAGHDGANAAFLDVAAQTTAKAKLVTTLPPTDGGVSLPPVLTASSDGRGGLTIHDEDAWRAYVTRVPAIPPTLRITGASAPALAAAAGTLGGMMSEARRKVLYGHAMAGTRPAHLGDDEARFLDDTTAEIAQMRQDGVAFDYPIDDIFPDDGTPVIAAPGVRTRKFRNP